MLGMTAVKRSTVKLKRRLQAKLAKLYMSAHFNVLCGRPPAKN